MGIGFIRHYGSRVLFLTLILGLTACGAKHRPETEEQAETVAAQEETIHLLDVLIEG